MLTHIVVVSNTLNSDLLNSCDLHFICRNESSHHYLLLLSSLYSVTVITAITNTAASSLSSLVALNHLSYLLNCRLKLLLKMMIGNHLDLNCQE